MLKIFLFILILIPSFIFSMETCESDEACLIAQKIDDHFDGKIVNIKEIYNDIPLLVASTLNGNTKALMVLVEYSETIKTIFDYQSYLPNYDTIFNALPWQDFNIQFFRKQQPNTSAEFYYWALFYSNVSLQRYAKNKEKGNDLQETALDYLNKAAGDGFSKAMYWLGHLYRHGLCGVKKNNNRAFHWKNEAAQMGYSPALFDTGLMQLKGIGTSKDLKKSIKLIQQAAESQQYPTANHYLGILYEQGKDPFEQNSINACRHYTIAKKMGCLDARINLGLLHINEEIDVIEGLHHLNKAARQGSARAQLTLGLLLCKGKPMQDITRGIELIKQSEKQGYENAAYELGKLILRGTLIKKNIDKAIELLIRANNKQAKFELAQLYLHGKEKKVPQNIPLGLSFLQEAVDDGYAPAEFMLGRMHLSGKNITTPDPQYGRKLIKKAAKKEFKPAQVYLETFM